MIDDQNQSIGLVPVQYSKPNQLDYSYYKTPNYSSEEILALEKAAQYNVDFIYFRRFSNRPPIPQIYIFNSINKSSDKNQLKELHRKLWNAVQVPLFFVFTPLEILIFNCFDKPEKDKKIIYKPFETIKIAGEVLKQLSKKDKLANQDKLKAFSAKGFDNGSFWESSKESAVYSLKIKFNNSSYERLIVELRNVLKDIITKGDLPKVIAKKLIVIGILIRYLEERTDEHGHSVFPKKGEERKFYKNNQISYKTFEQDFFEEFASNATSLIDVLKTPKTQSKNHQHPFVNLLDYLSGHFNGEIFKLTDTEKSILADLSDSRFEHLAHFFEGKLEGKQFVFWSLYAFNHLPIELISNIYEEFLESKSEGVVYTPPFLVNLLLDEVMPFSDSTTDFKILDPACGSGIFLVGAYKRLIGRWRIKNNWEEPDLKTLLHLLKENIYGADINEEAVRLAIFSLNLVMCDKLSPRAIWDNLEFENLQKNNLFDKDFFTLIETNQLNQGFDLVIGNPPFKSSLTESAKRIEFKAKTTRIKIINDKEQFIDVPDKQIALLFLEQSIQLCKENGWTCLIMPSGPFLYNIHSLDFRKNLLSKYHCPQIFDFTHLSRVLFGKSGDVATSAAFFQKKSPYKKGLHQITFRRIKQSKEKIFFDLNTYDFHYVSLELAKNEPLIWKANFLGGGRLFHIGKRLKDLRNLGRYIKKNNWIAAEGYILATKKQVTNLRILQELREKQQLSKEKFLALEKLEKKYEAIFLTNHNTIPANSFTEDGIDNTSIYKMKDKYFHNRREPNKKIFEPPHLLIREIAGQKSIPIEYRADYLTFTNQIIGIHAPKEAAHQLKQIEKVIKNSKVHLFNLAIQSSRYMVNKSSSLLKTDIENLPYPEDPKELELNEVEQILVDDFLDYLLPFRRNGETSEATKDVQPKQLAAFANTFCDILGSVYKNVKAYKNYIETATFICYPFYFGQTPNLEFENIDEAEKYLKQLVYDNIGQHIRITRVVRIYQNNVIYLIKPKQLRFWLRSIAIKDADMTFSDLRKQGY